MATFEHHTYKDFIESALEAGWEVSEGRWGYYENHERSVVLTKTLPKSGTSLRVWLTERNLGVAQWDEMTGERKPTIYPDNCWRTGVEAWAIPAGSTGLMNLYPKLSDVLKNGLSDEYWENLASICDSCHKVVRNLNHVAFANKICDDCLVEAKKSLEYPGWSE